MNTAKSMICFFRAQSTKAYAETLPSCLVSLFGPGGFITCYLVQEEKQYP